MQTLEDWWLGNLPIVEALAPDAANQEGKPRNVYVMRSSLLASIEKALAGQNLLTPFQVRGAFANYIDMLKADFKSIAASGWGPELIPDEDILQSQFPEVLEALEQAQTRLAELQALFAAADEEDFEDTDDTGVMNSEQVKSLKARLKEAKGMAKLCKRDPNMGDTALYQREAEQIEAQLQRHKVLEDEVKTLRSHDQRHRGQARRTGAKRPRENFHRRGPHRDYRTPAATADEHLPRLSARRSARLHQGHRKPVEQIRGHRQDH